MDYIKKKRKIFKHTSNLLMQHLTITRLPSAYSEATVQLLLPCRRTSFLPKAQEEVLEIKEDSWARATLGGVGEHRNTRHYRAAGSLSLHPLCICSYIKCCQQDIGVAFSTMLRAFA